MARQHADLAELKAQIDALPPKKRLQLVRDILTPQMELQLLVAENREKTKHLDQRMLGREIDRAVREVRADRKAKRQSGNP